MKRIMSMAVILACLIAGSASPALAQSWLGNNNGSPEIISASANAAMTQITILGTNLDGRGTPEVTLGVHELTLVSTSRSRIVANLPPGLAAGTYLLSVERRNRTGAIDFTIGVTGPQGPTGAMGPMGPAGANGSPGAPGAQGPQGDPGPQGVQGIQGLAGPAGPAGAAGATGATGATGGVGPQGVQGNQGPQGDTGTTGATGPQGPTGSPGAQGGTGEQGPAGATGPQGSAGPQGDPGPMGHTGPQGAQGPTGPEGPADLTWAITPTHIYAQIAGPTTTALDAFYDAPGNCSSFTPQLMQSFMSVTGGALSAVQISVFEPVSGVTIELRDGVGPGGTLLASVTKNIGAYEPISLGGVTLVAGHIYTIVYKTPGSSSFHFRCGNGYANGQGGTVGFFAGSDWEFKVWVTGGNPVSVTEAGQVGVGTETPTASIDVAKGTIRLRESSSPASNAACQAGEIRWDANFVYVCVAANTWRRSPLVPY